MRYHNFDLWIDSGATNGYPVRAVSPPNFGYGEARGNLNVQSEKDWLESQLTLLEHRKTDRTSLVALGTKLHELVFKDEIGRLFDACYMDLPAKLESGLRLRFRIEPQELRAIPWEFLYFPTEKVFLGTLTRCPLVRYIELRQRIRALATEPPIRLLIVVSSLPPPYPALDVDLEKHALLSALSELGDSVRLKFLEGPVTRQDLSDAILTDSFHCLHFIGHGEFMDNRSHLLLNQSNGDIDYLGSESLASLLRNHESMKLVVLNACQGGRIPANDSFLGLAPQLVLSGIPAVVAMQYSIYDKAAILFAREFYESLCVSVNRGRIDYAMSHARNRLEDALPGERDLGTPVLYMRTQDGLLFDVNSPADKRHIAFDLAAYHRSQTVGFTLKSNVDIATEQGEDATDDQKQLTELRARLRLRNWLLISGTGGVIAMFFFSWLSLFDLFGLDTRAEGLTMALGRKLDAQPLNKKIVLVPITAETEEALEKTYDRSWRKEHARAVDMLSKAGAKVVAFDFYLPEPSPYDEEFANAIDKAGHRGTSVVLGFRQLKDAKPQIAKKIGRAAAKLGALCVGERLGVMRSMPLIIQSGQKQPLPSLSLAIFSVDQGLDKISLDEESWSARQIRLEKSESSAPHVVHFSEITTSGQYQRECPVIDRGDRVGELLIEVPSDTSLLASQQILSYADLVTSNNNASLSGVKDKLILIGLGTKVDIHRENPGWTAPRLGIELHASALNSLLNNRAVRSAETEVQFLLMLGLAVLGAFIRYWIPANHRGWCRVLVMLAVAAYLVINVTVYLKWQRLLNPVYHIGSLLLAYTLANWIERKWFA